jgi:carboxypeptidase PM20D1
MLKKAALLTFLLLAVLTTVVFWRACQMPGRQQPAVEALALPPLPTEAVAHLQKAIQCPTISYGDPALWQAQPFLDLRQLLENAYPLIHSTWQREIISQYSYLYKWPGKNPTLSPYIFMAHQDVVPVEENTRHLWAASPFGGVVRNDTIFGRGAIDNKCNLISIFEAGERLLQRGFQPERTLYFIFGHDEEIGGLEGALRIARLLEERGVQAELIIDEGGIITRQKAPPGLSKPVALIATAEKGYLSLEFSVEKKGGHSSMPESETAIDILMKGLTRLHEHPFPMRFVPASRGFADYIGPEMPFAKRLVFNNRWLLESVLIQGFSRSAPSRAMLHTTAVTTLVNAGIKDNVIPTVATAVVNYRLLPGDSIRYVVERTKSILADTNIHVKIKGRVYSEASGSDVADGVGFQKVSKIIRQTYDNIYVAPFLMIGATDSRHFSKVSNQIVKFSPVMDPIGFHTYNEQVSINSFQHSIWFFEQMMMQ